jgi:RimJ/RimL family protein N-acetyltransferase
VYEGRRATAAAGPSARPVRAGSAFIPQVSVTVPILETERTIMRGWSESDLDACAEWMADPEVMRFLGGHRDRQTAWRTIALYIGHWSLRGYGLWAVQRKSDGALIGRVGIWHPEGWPGAEVGWTLSRAAWGQGYATECGRAATDWAWANLPDLTRLLSVIDPANTASRRVAERLGMKVVGDWKVGEPEIDVLLYGVDRPA